MARSQEKTVPSARRNLRFPATRGFAVSVIGTWSLTRMAVTAWRIGSSPGRSRVLPSQLRPTPVDRKLGAGREGRVEREEEDGLRNFLRRPPALHRDHTNHLFPNLSGCVTGKRFADDRRVDGTGRHRVDANLARKQLSSECPSK